MTAKRTKKKSNTAENPLGIMTAFPTYVGHKNFSDVGGLNDRLRLSIYKNKASNPDGVTRSNTAGTWHSDIQLLKWIDVPELSDMFARSILQYTTSYGANPADEISLKMNAWAMIYNDGGYATVHTHPNCHYAAVYYLDNPGDEKRTMVTGIRTTPGDIEFVDTRGAQGCVQMSLNGEAAFRMQPRAGDMIVFPSWLPHFVHPVIGEEDRICIACNATVVKHTKGTIK